MLNHVVFQEIGDKNHKRAACRVFFITHVDINFNMGKLKKKKGKYSNRDSQSCDSKPWLFFGG